VSYPDRDYPDQVPRLKAFQAAHPEIEIRNPADTGGWWSAHRAGKNLCVEQDLGHLLDRLEWLLEHDG